MAVFVAFLRGVNVAGHRKIGMAELRRVHEAMGHDNVSTYLQSGNVVFDCAGRDRAKLAAAIQTAYADTLGLSAAVMVRGAAELARIVDRCPIALTPEREPRFLHALILSGAPGRGAGKALADYDGPEEWRLDKDTLYVYYTDGAGRSKLTLDLVERRLGVTATGRNSNTITKLAELAAR